MQVLLSRKMGQEGKEVFGSAWGTGFIWSRAWKIFYLRKKKKTTKKQKTKNSGYLGKEQARDQKGLAHLYKPNN